MGDEPNVLELVSTIGFAGGVRGGLLAHPDGRHIVYPLGCTIVVQDLTTQKQSFLAGHSNNVSCLACSPSGMFLASGQVTFMGFKADVIVWQFSERGLYCRLTLHKVKVQALAFSPSDKFLATLGGQDDNSIVIWNIATKDALCGSQACLNSVGPVYALTFSRGCDDIVVTAGKHTLRVWEINADTHKIIPTDCNLGQMKRVVNCLQMAKDDEHVYCGTTTGDVLQVNINTKLLRHFGPQKEKLSLGVTSIQLLPSEDLLVGTGDGTIAVMRGAPSFKLLKSAKVVGEVTSVVLRGSGNQFFIGTDAAQLYQSTFQDFDPTLMRACHNTPVTDISFPLESSELFATSSGNDVRVWHVSTGKELLRLVVPNLTCHAVTFTPDGRAIITAWSDGKIRAFYPETARPMYTIHDAHHKGATAVACTSDSRSLISGGGEGEVRVWEVKDTTQYLKEALKEHKGAITCIKIRKDDSECVSASNDGTCIIWDLRRLVRSQVIFANTMFRSVCYHQDECQIITGGTDRKIGYWETYDGSQIRELEGSQTDSINGMDIQDSYFVTGGGDKLIKLWRYNEGTVSHIGVGHSAEVTKVKISPNGQHILSVSVDGAILRWRFPPHINKKAENSST